MYNYLAICDNLDVKPNYEVDEYKWFPMSEAIDALKDAKLALEFFKYYDTNIRN